MSYILLINGPLCSGKTSLVKHFLRNEKRLFRASFDAIKREISDFDGETDRMLVKELLFSLSKEALDKNLSIIVEGSASIMLEMREYYSQLANKKFVNFFEINLEAPLESLQKRLQERVSQGKALTVSKPDQLLKRYDFYMSKKDKNVPIYDTSKYLPEKIYSMIVNDVLKQ